MQFKSPLLVAVGVAIGIAVASLSPRPTPPPPPQIEVRPGHVEADGTVRLLRPLSMRVGDEIMRLGLPESAGRDRALVFLDINGSSVIVTLEVQSAVRGDPTGLERS
jgi:hypothetical protein